MCVQGSPLSQTLLCLLSHSSSLLIYTSCLSPFFAFYLSLPLSLPLSLLGESPRDLPQKPSEDTQAFVSVVAHGVVRLQERGMVLSPWSLMALVLLQSPGGLSLEILTRRTAWLKGLALKFGALLDWPGKSERKNNHNKKTSASMRR